MSGKHSLTEEEDAFLGYVEQMRNSVGKRFIMHHISNYGFESFEEFWEKLDSARHYQPPQLELSKEEADSLAHAIHADTRRMFLEKGAGLLLTAFGMGAAKDGGEKLMESAGKKHVMPGPEALEVALKLGLGSAASMIGIALVVKPDEPTCKTIAEIAKGSDGEKNVGQLVSTLNAIFKPVDVAMQETRPREIY